MLCVWLCATRFIFVIGVDSYDHFSLLTREEIHPFEVDISNIRKFPYICLFLNIWWKLNCTVHNYFFIRILAHFIFCDSSKCDINLDFMPSYGSIISYHLHSPYFAYPFVWWWTFWLLSFSDCKWHFYEHLYVELGAYVFTLPGWMTRKATTGTFMWSFRRNCHIVFQSGFIILHSSSNFWGFWFLRSSLTSVTVM